MSKDNQYVVFQTLRKGRNNDGSCFQITPTKNGTLFFTLANQKGIRNNLPEFDYDNAFKFGLSDLEAAKVALAIRRQLAKNGYEEEIKFPHLNAAKPKTIVFKFSQYNGKAQCGLSVFAQGSNQRANIFLNEDELYVLEINLEAQINLYNQKNIIELEDTKQFKQFMAGGNN